MLTSEGIVPRIIAESERLIHDLIVEAPVILCDGHLVWWNTFVSFWEEMPLKARGLSAAIPEIGHDRA